MSNGRYELLIKWPSGQSTLSGEITDQQYGEICRVLSPDRRAELAALKAGQGEAITEVSAETFSSDGTSDIITCNLPIGTKLYAAPPATGVIVPTELLERAIRRIELNTYSPFGEPQTPRDAENRRVTDELRALLARQEVKS